MKKLLPYFLITLLNLLFLNVFAQSTSWQWTKSVGGSNDDIATSNVSDKLGNVYVVGYYTSASVSFDSISLSNTGASDMFIVKYAPSGNAIWARRAGSNAGGNTGAQALSVALDTSGNVFVVGHFKSSSIKFGSTMQLNNIGSSISDIFIVKYNSNGTELWARRAGGSLNDQANCVTTDKSGNAYIGGLFYSSSITFGTITKTDANNTGTAYDYFVAKYDVNGTAIWVKPAGGTNYGSAVTSIKVDNVGNIYAVGNYTSTTLILGSTTYSNYINNGAFADLFILKYNNTGTVLWAKSIGGNNEDNANSIAVDSSNNIVVSGIISSTNMVVESDTLYGIGLFLIKYNSSGNLIWAENADGAGSNTICIGTSNSIYMGGLFNYSFVLADDTLTSNGNSDMFIAKFDSSGSAEWVRKEGGSGNADFVNSICSDLSNNVYLTGYYNSSSINFDTSTLYSAGLADLFLSKLNDNTITNIRNVISPHKNKITISPNPSEGKFKLSSENSNVKIITVTISDILGHLIKDYIVYATDLELDLTNQSSGVYFVTLMTNDNRVETNIIVKK